MLGNGNGKISILIDILEEEEILCIPDYFKLTNYLELTSQLPMGSLVGGCLLLYCGMAAKFQRTPSFIQKNPFDIVSPVRQKTGQIFLSCSA